MKTYTQNYIHLTCTLN